MDLKINETLLYNELLNDLEYAKKYPSEYNFGIIYGKALSFFRINIISEEQVLHIQELIEELIRSYKQELKNPKIK